MTSIWVKRWRCFYWHKLRAISRSLSICGPTVGLTIVMTLLILLYLVSSKALLLLDVLVLDRSHPYQSWHYSRVICVDAGSASICFVSAYIFTRIESVWACVRTMQEVSTISPSPAESLLVRDSERVCSDHHGKHAAILLQVYLALALWCRCRMLWRAVLTREACV